MTKIQLNPPKTIVWKNFLGVNAHLLHFYAYGMTDRIPLFIQSLKKLGINKIRLDLHWDTVEAWGHEGEFEKI